ncbi:hypothetical protein [Herbidospora mongoliensis]|uniref:hypothetical protein n=1 Tax=Herbidospora mongoliensis TaxID=688067 RepID=UPI000833AD9F|nr:hypothetical protein [Herbidospora mongoliensis]
MILHRPRWEPVDVIGDVMVERCGKTRISPSGAKVDPAAVARAGIAEALLLAWPNLVNDPIFGEAYVDALAEIAVSAVRKEIGL